MDSLAATFKQFASLFSNERHQQFGGNSSIKLIHQDAPEIIKDLVTDFALYKVYGSVGTGNWAEIPWVAVLDKGISTSTQKGYYIVYLFDKKLQYLYVSLSLGYTQFENEYGVSEARTNIQAVAQHYANMITKSPGKFKSGPVQLNAENNLGKGYELGAVLSKRYVISQLNDDELSEDLKLMLGFYNELKSLVGDSVLNIQLDVNADIYDDSVKKFQKVITAKTYSSVDEAIINELLNQTRAYPRQIREKLVKQIIRNRKIVNLVKKNNNFICSLCGREPFVQKNGLLYAEADHIIPLGGDTMGPDSVDNLRCLCAQCHAIITHGSDEEKEALLANSKGASSVS
jgi:5-methylcytosine-specific restriction protein A